MKELSQAGKQCHDAGIAEAKSRSPLATNNRRQDDLLEGGSAYGAALAHALGVQETLVGLSIVRRSDKWLRSRPMQKSRVSLMVVSVRRAQPCL